MIIQLISLLTVLIGSCQAAYTEMPREAARLNGEIFLAGEHHVSRLTVTMQGELTEGYPQGLLGLGSTSGSIWLLGRGGWLKRLDAKGEHQIWYPLDTLIAAERQGLGWLAGTDRLLGVELDGGHPCITAELPLPLPGRPAQIRAAGESVYLMQAGSLFLLEPDGAQEVIALPAGCRDWAALPASALAISPDGCLLRLVDGCWKQHEIAGRLNLVGLEQCKDGVWLECLEGDWHFLPYRDLQELQKPAPVRSQDALPVDGQCLVDRHHRLLWLNRNSVWQATALPVRDDGLLDRHFRLTAEWRLSRTGEVYRAGEFLAGQPDGLSLHRAGAGPLLLHEGGIRCWTDSGVEIGGWQGSELRCGYSFEDYFAVASEDSLYTFWANEEDPWLQQSLYCPGVLAMTGSPDFLLARTLDELVLFSRALPWQLQEIDRLPVPQGLEDQLFVDENLLLVSRDDLHMLNVEQSGFQQPEGSWLHAGGRRIIRRGVEHLLLQQEDGLLHQIRLEDRRPRQIEWSMQLPMTGKLEIFRDTLRLTGEAGWLDLALPAGGPAVPIESRLLAEAEIYLPGEGWLSCYSDSREMQRVTELARWLRLGGDGASVLIPLNQAGQMDK
jgi:hypothetical protein